MALTIRSSSTDASQSLLKRLFARAPSRPVPWQPAQFDMKSVAVAALMPPTGPPSGPAARPPPRAAPPAAAPAAAGAAGGCPEVVARLTSSVAAIKDAPKHRWGFIGWRPVWFLTGRGIDIE